MTTRAKRGTNAAQTYLHDAGSGRRRMLKRISSRLCFMLILCAFSLAPATGQSSLPAPPASAAPADDGQWRMPAKNFVFFNYRAPTEINTDNVKNLQVAF